MLPAQTFVNKPTDYARYLMKLGFPQLPHYPIGVKRVHINSPNGEGTVFQTFWNYKQHSCIQLLYHQRAGKTNLFHMRGCRFHAGNTLCTFQVMEGLSMRNFCLLRKQPTFKDRQIDTAKPMLNLMGIVTLSYGYDRMQALLLLFLWFPTETTTWLTAPIEKMTCLHRGRAGLYGVWFKEPPEEQVWWPCPSWQLDGGHSVQPVNKGGFGRRECHGLCLFDGWR